MKMTSTAVTILRTCIIGAGLAGSGFSLAAMAEEQAQTAFNFARSPEAIATSCDAVLGSAKDELDALGGASDPATFDGVMVPFDQMLVSFLDEFFISNLMSNVHTVADVRAASSTCFQALYGFYNQLTLNRPLYDRLSAIETEGLVDDQAYMVEYWMAQFQKSGVDKDAATREQVLALNREIIAIGEEFDRNIREDVREISISPEALEGLPQDFIDGHAPGNDGLVTLTTSYADGQPVLKYAIDDGLRHDLLKVFLSRAYPQNDVVLKNLMAKRHQLATLLGHDNFAQLSMIGTMMKSPARARDFLNTLSGAITTSVAMEKAQLLARLQEIDPEAVAVKPWQRNYLAALVRQENYALDAKEVRQYFNYDKVRDGIFTLTSDLFDIEIRPWDTETWHEDAEAYSVYEGGELIGRFFLDMHPRDGKYTHAAQFDVQFGVKGKQTPIASLVTNFPEGAMEHGQVETFLHEFGHLLHFIFAGQSEFGLRRFMLEDDFGEAPSTMLEEWVWDYDTLSKFAKNDAGETIPEGLVQKMNAARYFGQGIGAASQLHLSTLSLSVYDRDPETIDVAKMSEELAAKKDPFGHFEGTYFYASFVHLNSYSSNYYTYQWSQAIAEDLLSRFRAEGLRNKATARDYRNLVLGASGMKSANDLVADFLGRKFTIDAYVKRLSRGGAEPES